MGPDTEANAFYTEQQAPCETVGDEYVESEVTTAVDAIFDLVVNDVVTVTGVTVAVDLTNTSIDDLVADINAALASVNTALADAGLTGSVRAGRSGDRVTIYTDGLGPEASLMLNAGSGNTAITELKFVDGLEAVPQDAVFTISVNGGIFVLVTVAFFLTEGALIWFIIRYRERPGRKAQYFADHKGLEAIWWIVPGKSIWCRFNP